MDLSIIIANYNTKDITLNCLKSLAEEASDIKKEIIVVDDASSDGSVEVLKNYQKSKKDVTVIFNKKTWAIRKQITKG